MDNIPKIDNNKFLQNLNFEEIFKTQILETSFNEEIQDKIKKEIDKIIKEYKFKKNER